MNINKYFIRNKNKYNKKKKHIYVYITFLINKINRKLKNIYKFNNLIKFMLKFYTN